MRPIGSNRSRKEENAKAAKDKNYKKKTFDPSSVSVDTLMFDRMSEYTKQKQSNETADYYNNILTKYQDYITKRLSVEKKFQSDLEKLEAAGGTEATGDGEQPDRVPKGRYTG